MTRTELYASKEVWDAIAVAAAAEALNQSAWLRRTVVQALKTHGHLAPDAPLTPGAASRKPKAFAP